MIPGLEQEVESEFERLLSGHFLDALELIRDGKEDLVHNLPWVLSVINERPAWAVAVLAEFQATEILESFPPVTGPTGPGIPKRRDGLPYSPSRPPR